MTTQAATVTQRTKDGEYTGDGNRQIVDPYAQLMELIARRAFEIFQSRGGSSGHELDDWVRAENELLHPAPLNVSESCGEYVVRAEVPGFGSCDIEVNVEPNRLRISGQRKTLKEEENSKMVLSEWCADRIFRILELHSAIDTSRVSTTSKDGILTVDLPKVQVAK